MLSVVTAVVGAASAWWTRRCDLKEAEFKTAIAIEENRTRLAADQLQYNHEWEMASLKSIPAGLKYMSFCMFAGPVLLSMLAPFFDIDLAPMWDSLRSVPEWQQTGFTCITGAIWGVAQLKSMGGVRGVLGWSDKASKTAVAVSEAGEAVLRSVQAGAADSPVLKENVPENPSVRTEAGKSRVQMTLDALLDPKKEF